MALPGKKTGRVTRSLDATSTEIAALRSSLGDAAPESRR